MKKINLDIYNRKDHYEFFKSFDEPFFGLSSLLDFQYAYALCKEEGFSFYAYYLHKILLAINHIPEFRYRIIDNELYDVGEVSVSATVLRKDKTFGYSYISFNHDFTQFQRALKTEIDRVKKGTGLELHNKQNVIHFTAVPWVNFTAVSHARMFKQVDSIPKIAVGKLNQDYSMSVSVHANHAVVDGYHIGLFFQQLQSLLKAQ